MEDRKKYSPKRHDYEGNEQEKTSLVNHNETHSSPLKFDIETTGRASSHHHQRGYSHDNIHINTTQTPLVALLLMGFPESDSLKALNVKRNKFNEALSYLSDIAINEYINNFSKKQLLWRSPLIIRVGSWMPVKSASHGEKIEYIITVLSSGHNHSHAVKKRYSEMYMLYKYLEPNIKKSFPYGMTNRFIDDRCWTWLCGINEEVYERRREMFDGWLKEIVLNPILMTQVSIHNTLCNFCGVGDKIVYYHES